MDYPRLWKAILMTVIGVALLTGRWPVDVQITLMWLGVAALGFAGYALVRYIMEDVTTQYEKIRAAMRDTERVKLFELASKLTVEQATLMRNYKLVVEVMMGQPFPTYTLKTPDGESFPMEFVERFLDVGDEEYLAPVGFWSEGSHDHELADEFTKLMIYMGYAKKWNGNKSAKWVDFDGAMRALGISGNAD
jgi:hypothetical protein